MFCCHDTVYLYYTFAHSLPKSVIRTLTSAQNAVHFDRMSIANNNSSQAHQCAFFNAVNVGHLKQSILKDFHARYVYSLRGI